MARAAAQRAAQTGRGAARAAAREDVVFRGVPGTVAASGTINVREAIASQQRESGVAALPSAPVSAPAPMPIPDMPPAEGVSPTRDSLETAAPLLSDVPTPLAPPLTAGFAALGDNNYAIPPDTYGAVGPNHLMVAANTQVRFQNKTGGVLSTLTLNQFWSVVNGGSGAFDPRVVYDQLAGRWVSVASDDPYLPTAGVLVGVSRNSDPTGTWDLFKISTGGGNWADYPTLGFNKNWVAVQVNIFNSGGIFQESRVYAISRAPFFGGPPATLSYRTITLTGVSGTQAPAVTFDPTLTLDDLYLLQAWSSVGGQLRLWKLTGPVGSETVQSIGFPADSFPWSNGVAGDFAPQDQGPPGCSYCPSPPCRVETNDSRIQSVVYRNGRIWAAHTVFLPTGTPARSSVQWWQVNPDATVGQRGLVDDSSGTRFFAFPSLAVNKNDDVLLGYSRFQGDQFAGASYSFRTAIDAPNTMQPESPLRDGDACYFKDYGYGENRWGDYSATVVDPVDDKTLWTIQEYAAPPDPLYSDPTQRDRWGTWWGMLDPTPAVSIANASVAEGDIGTSTLSFDVSLSLPTSQTVTVPWSTADGSATTADNDYVPVASGLLTFNPGETLKSAIVTVNGDIKHESDETLRVNLGVPTNATVATGTATGTILNDDAVPQVSIGDVRVVEGNTGTSPYTLAPFKVSLSNPSDTPVTVYYQTVDGSALAPGDYQAVTTTPVTFPAAAGTGPYPIDRVEQTVTINVVGDTLVEGDETYYVDLVTTPPPVGCTLLKTRGTGTILDDDAQTPDVRALAVVSDSVAPHGATDGRNRLEWVNVPGPMTPAFIRIGWTVSASPVSSGGTCTDPASPTIALSCSSGCPTSYLHSSVQLGYAYCYKVWIDYGSLSAGVSAKGIPFDASARIKWKYFRGTGATSVAPPTVGSDAVLGASNDGLVHGMLRGPAGGLWPGGWVPVNLGSPVQARSPIVPMAGGWRAFFTTQNGWVYAIDTQTGAIIWETQLETPLAGPIPGQAAPAGIFAAFGGAWDYLLVGTRDASNPNYFYALSPLTGAVLDQFPKAGELDAGGSPIGTLGIVNGMAGVDYQRKRVCFGTIKSTVGTPDTRTLWCLNLGPPGDALSYGWALDQSIVGDIDGSPIIRGNRVYVGNTTGVLWALDPDDPLNAAKRYSVATSDGGVKDFPFPDRSTNTVYFSTTNQVHACVDTGTAFNCTSGGGWTVTPPAPPSPVLFSSGRVYAGGASGQLFELDATTGTLLTPILQLDSALPPATIGTPSLDAGFNPNIVLVGSTNGVFYAIAVP
jgi:outer membrane protein assembly factor BamB